MNESETSGAAALWYFPLTDGNKWDFWLRGQKSSKHLFKPNYFQKSTKTNKKAPKIIWKKNS